MSICSRKLGMKGEEIAVNHLKRLGYQILERNFTCKSGEIDIVAKDGATVVFIEVKTRKSDMFGNPSEAVTLRKQAQISRTALHYLSIHNLYDEDARFDVVSILHCPNRKPVIEVIPNAFDLSA